VSSQVVGWPVWAGVIAKDLEAQRRFYRDSMGFKEIWASDSAVWFDLGWPNLFEVIAQSTQPQYSAPRYQVAFAVGDIRVAYAELVARGVKPLTEVDGEPRYGGYWCYFEDAEGHVFGITQRLGPPWPARQDRAGA